jgi:hypothetical protein
MEKDNDGVVNDYGPASTGRRSESGIRRRLSVIVEFGKQRQLLFNANVLEVSFNACRAGES